MCDCEKLRPSFPSLGYTVYSTGLSSNVLSILHNTSPARYINLPVAAPPRQSITCRHVRSLTLATRPPASMARPRPSNRSWHLYATSGARLRPRLNSAPSESVEVRGSVLERRAGNEGTRSFHSARIRPLLLRPSP